MSGPVKVVRTKLFIGNLDPATQSSELSSLFEPFGTVLEASVIKDYGFVHYGTVEEAEKAAAALNNKEFHGKRLRVELSTSTVRHRPGQPEPTNGLRNSRSRAAAMMSGNGLSRYNSTSSTSGIGPVRHTVSAWVRGDAHPYDGIPMDPGIMATGYGATSTIYDHSHSYDARSDPRQYCGDRRDSGYVSGFDTTRDNIYGTPSYPTMVGGSGKEQTSMYSVHDYQGLPPLRPPPPLLHTRGDGMDCRPSRMYDRNQGAFPLDLYYSGEMPQGPSGSVEPYHSYGYHKYYSSRPRDPEFPVATGQHPPQHNHNVYTAYRGGPYVTAGVQPLLLQHDYGVAFQQPPPSLHQRQTSYLPPNQLRQSHGYGTLSATHTTLYPSASTHYYGTQQRV